MKGVSFFFIGTILKALSSNFSYTYGSSGETDLGLQQLQRDARSANAWTTDKRGGNGRQEGAERERE